MSAAAATLAQAKALIATPDRWNQGSAIDYYRRARCATRAIQDTGVPYHHRLDALAYLGEALEIDPSRIAPWNDERERSHADVLEAFDRAIQLANEQESLA